MFKVEKSMKNNGTRFPCRALTATLWGSLGQKVVQYSVLMVNAPIKYEKESQTE